MTTHYQVEAFLTISWQGLPIGSFINFTGGGSIVFSPFQINSTNGSNVVVTGFAIANGTTNNINASSSSNSGCFDDFIATTPKSSYCEDPDPDPECGILVQWDFTDVRCTGPLQNGGKFPDYIKSCLESAPFLVNSGSGSSCVGDAPDFDVYAVLR